jgi:hypothetical protein
LQPTLVNSDLSRCCSNSRTTKSCTSWKCTCGRPRLGGSGKASVFHRSLNEMNSQIRHSNSLQYINCISMYIYIDICGWWFQPSREEK